MAPPASVRKDGIAMVLRIFEASIWGYAGWYACALAGAMIESPAVIGVSVLVGVAVALTAWKRSRFRREVST